MSEEQTPKDIATRSMVDRIDKALYLIRENALEEILWEGFNNTDEGLMARIEKEIFKIVLPTLPYGSAKARRIEAGVKHIKYVK